MRYEAPLREDRRNIARTGFVPHGGRQHPQPGDEWGSASVESLGVDGAQEASTSEACLGGKC